MSKRGLLLFLSAGIFWGLPYFFIAIALEDFSTWTIIFARTLIGALVLIPYALAKGTLLPALRAWPYVLLFAALEMIGPWWLITEAEKHISSGLTGLLVATVPFFALGIAVFILKDRSSLRPMPLLGMALGFSGVATLVGIDSILGNTEPLWVLAVVMAAIGYAIAPIMATRKMPQAPSSGVIGLSMVVVAIVYAIPAGFNLPLELSKSPSLNSWFSLLVLGVVCSALAFVIFFDLLKEIGPVKASLITYVNTAVALLLGTLILQEPITPGLLLGIPMVAAGLYLSARK